MPIFKPRDPNQSIVEDKLAFDAGFAEWRRRYVEAEVANLKFGRWLLRFEAFIVLIIVLCTIVGTYRYVFGNETNEFKELVKLLNENWKGSLVLLALLFFRTGQEILHRIEKFKTPLGDMRTQGLPQEGSVKVQMKDEAS